MAGADTQHPDYKTQTAKWKRCRDVMAGQDAVHDSAQAYLPALKDQEPAEYRAYLKRTPFYNASARTSEGLLGMMFRRDPMLDAPDALRDMLLDVTLTGISLDGLTEQIAKEVLDVGRCGVLVEHPRVAQQPVNLAAASAQNLRPYATLYKAESIINWRIERINNKVQPTLVVLHEAHETAVDEFETANEPQYRALMLLGGQYIQRIYRIVESTLVLVEEIVPLMNGNPLTEIPFYPFGPVELSLSVQGPPLLDLVDLNLSHYRTTADLEHGAHFTGLPTPVVSGYQPQENEKLYIGSTRAWVFPNPDAKAAYLEFTGQGLSALEKLLDRKEAQMAAIGARMLAPEKSGVEAAETVAMRHTGEASVLAATAKLIASGVSEFLRYMAKWAGITGEVAYTLNTDYFPARMTAQELTALVGAWQQGAISDQTLFENLQAGEIIAAATTLEEEQARIGDAGPAMKTPTVPGTDE